MKTKEAIEFLEREILEECGKPSQYRWTKSLCKLPKEFESVIALLKRCEAYKEMWGELKKEHTEAKIRNTCPEGLIDRYLFMREIEVIEQKYFPKEAKQ